MSEAMQAQGQERTHFPPARALPPAYDRPSWECCFKAGLTVSQAAALRQQSRDVGYAWASKRGLKWPAGLPGPAARTPLDDMPPLPPITKDDLDLRACLQLWGELLLMMWRDALPDRDPPRGRTATHRSRDQKLLQRDALRWFGSRDFHMVCALAGLNGEAVLDRFHARCRERGIAGVGVAA